MRVYITHGYTAAPDKHWFPWLESALKPLGIGCYRLAMPNSTKPDPQEWLLHHLEQIQLDEDTLLIGHSLGCIASLNLLASTANPIRGAILVSGFYQPLPNLPELNPFADLFQQKIAQPRALARIQTVSYDLIAARNDSVVASQYSHQLAQFLNAESYLELATGGHFLDREGCTQLPELLPLIQRRFGLTK